VYMAGFLPGLFVLLLEPCNNNSFVAAVLWRRCGLLRCRQGRIAVAAATKHAFARDART
jgi:hypothetical protein